MSGRATDESCISRERGDRVAGAEVLSRQEQATPQGALARWPAVTGTHGPDTLHKANEEFTEAFLQRKRIMAVATDLMKAREEGVVSLDGIVRQQVRDTAVAPAGIADLAIGPEMAIILKIMLVEARARVSAGGVKPDFAIISIFRPGDGEKSPHRGRRALDISRYGGFLNHVNTPDQAAKGVTLFYRDLASHATEINFKYSFGLPRNLRTDNAGIADELTGKPAQSHLDIYLRAIRASMSLDTARASTTFPAQVRQKYNFTDVFFDHSYRPNHPPKFSLDDAFALFKWPGLKDEWQKIRQNGGVGLVQLYPDAPDHVHIESH